MTQETESERYIRLAALISTKDEAEYGNSCIDSSKFTSKERRDLGNILADNMTPWEFSCDVQGVGDIAYAIAEDYASLNSIDIAIEFVASYQCKTVDAWIEENGLPLPDRDGMIEYLMSDIDEEEYINKYYEDILDMLPDQCEFNLSDSEIIYLFEVYVNEPEIDGRVICDAANRFKCVGDDCYHAMPHVINKACNELDCDKYKIAVKCIPVELE